MLKKILYLLIFLGFIFNVHSLTYVDSCGTTLNVPGETYLLNHTLTTTSTCLNIQTNDITLDCNDYQITDIDGPSSSDYGISISTTQIIENVTIKNCQINNFTAGINLNGLVNSNFSNLKLSDNTRGIYFYNSINGNNITNNIFNNLNLYNNGRGFYFRITGGPVNNNIFKNLYFSNNGYSIDFRVDSSGNPDRSIKYNTFDNNFFQSSAIHLYVSGGNYNIMNNNFSNNNFSNDESRIFSTALSSSLNNTFYGNYMNSSNFNNPENQFFYTNISAQPLGNYWVDFTCSNSNNYTIDYNGLTYTVCNDDDLISGSIVDMGPLLNMGKIILNNPQPQNQNSNSEKSVFPLQGIISIYLTLTLLFIYFIFN